MLVQPSAARAVPRSAAYPVDRLITVVTRRITVTATYAAHRAQLPGSWPARSLPVPPEGAAAPASAVRAPGALASGLPARASLLPATATSYTGRGSTPAPRPGRRG